MQELPKAYEAKAVEAEWARFWESKQLFRADPHSKKPPYSIVMPPPNVTGVLHMGHALVSVLQDILIRWHRMRGDEVLWVPGTDHAGISTQTVVERHLIKTQGKRRKDFSREEFLSHVWKWKDESQHRILNQLKLIGCSCDWSRLRFTMDEGNNRAVRVIFKMMYDQGLIYRGDYLVNWDPVTQTALADDEVEYETKQSFLWHLKYPLKDGSGFVHVATTRPETMLGDTAIAVSPKDQRYAHLVGKTAVVPFVNREIPIIADPFVDPEFGSGMVKVTPAHDPNDYQMGLRCNLPRINIMTPDGRINENGAQFSGMTMEEGRTAVVAAMKERGLLEKVESHTNRVGVSYRSKAIIEPYMSKQWFVRMSLFKDRLRAAVEQEKTRLIPKNWENTYFHWIDNLRDWCISRQLWWGHRIPIWYNKNDPEKQICFAGEGIPDEVRAAPDQWEQDEDVLDTWFSSALWPFSVFGWPEKTPDFERFYPNSVLVTGHDILFFWVARMLMMGEYATGKLPFPEVFLHGLIYGKSYWTQDAAGGITYVSDQERREYELGKVPPPHVHFRWEKMSKSKGNVIDPIEIIAEYGTDAMRMALCASATQAREIDLDRRRFEEYRNFTNKVWNGARFVFMNLEGDEAQGTTPLTAKELSEGLEVSLLGLEDRWILSRLNRVVRDVNQKLSNYQFDQAALEAYDFFWKEFCSYYVEIVKPILFGKSGTPAERKNKQKLLVIVLCQAIRLIHPITPFITEELFHRLKELLSGVQSLPGIDPYSAECVNALRTTACATAPYPQVIRESDMNPEIEQAFALMERVVYAIRNIRGEMQLSPGTATEVQIIGQNGDATLATVRKHQGIITALVRTSGVVFHAEEPQKGFACMGAIDTLKIRIPLPAQLLEQEKVRLTKESVRLLAQRDRLQGQLGNADFVQNAPQALVDKHRVQLQQAESELSAVQSKLQALG